MALCGAIWHVGIWVHLVRCHVIWRCITCQRQNWAPEDIEYIGGSAGAHYLQYLQNWAPEDIEYIGGNASAHYLQYLQKWGPEDIDVMMMPVLICPPCSCHCGGGSPRGLVSSSSSGSSSESLARTLSVFVNQRLTARGLKP